VDTHDYRWSNKAEILYNVLDQKNELNEHLRS